MTTEITDEIRAGVLGAIGRGMSKSCAARADGIALADVEVILAEAGGLEAVIAAHRPGPVVDGPQPCTVCGVIVTAEFIERTGQARHAWHPAPAPRLEQP